MKKVAILTSILALAACGGGGAGGGVAAPVTQISDITEMRASVTNKTKVINAVNQATATGAKKVRAAAPENNDLDTQYNAAVETINLAKEILANLIPDDITDENLNDVIVALRLAGHTGFGTDVEAVKNFISGDSFSSNGAIGAIDEIISNATQTIDKVEFHTISTNDDGTPDTGILTMQTDGENIKSIKTTWEYDDGSEHKTTFIPTGGNTFKGTVTGDGPDESFTGELVMLGKEHHLKYADFGYMKYTMVEDGEKISSRHFLTGGYDVMKITEMPTDKTDFTGTAVATMWNDAENAHLNMRDDNAILTFDDGNETLVMNFGDWYNVTISNTGDAKSITFTGTPTDERFQLNTASTPDNSKLSFETTYYGDGTPSEATASFGYVEGEYTSNNTTLRSFTGAFGGAIQE